jgi:hypothetical protein
MTRRLRLLVAGIICAVVAAVLVVLVAGPLSRPPAPSASRSPGAAPAPRASTTVNPSTAPVPPPQGAYLGAWVGPDDYTQANEIAAVDSLQTVLGHKLSIVHTYLKWQAPFPTPSDMAFVRQGSTLLISWAGTDTKQIISGADDNWIRTRAQQIKALGEPVFLEWRWEMDRPNLRSQEHSGADYVAAWDHIRAIFSAAGVTNAAWVWCPTAAGFSDGRAAAFYPGNNEVDWICADAYPEYGTDASFAATVTPFLAWASKDGKPVMIGEFGVPESYGAQQRAQWLRAAQHVVLADHQIKALLYFDANPAGQGPAGSYALGDTAALSAFRAMADQPYFNPGAAR